MWFEENYRLPKIDPQGRRLKELIHQFKKERNLKSEERSPQSHQQTVTPLPCMNAVVQKKDDNSDDNKIEGWKSETENEDKRSLGLPL